MINKAIAISLFLVSGWVIAQANQSEQPAKEKTGQVTVQGCVGRSSGDFIITRSDPANTYVLEGTRKIKLDPYLGQQVEVTGTESATMSNSSNFRRRPASPVTIMVESINTIGKRCEK